MSIIFNSADMAETMNNGVANVTGSDSTITENYTNVVQHGIKIDMSVSEKTISGTPPLTFNSNGTPLIDYTIYGNTIQDGTPTPQECGERTENLWNVTILPNSSITTENYWEKYDSSVVSTTMYMPCLPNTKYYLHTPSNITSGNFRVYTSTSDTIPTLGNSIPVYEKTRSSSPVLLFKFTTGANDKLIVVQVATANSQTMADNAVLDKGYKIPISVSRRNYNVYIGNSPLRKAIDSSNAVDTINYGTQQLIRRVDSNGTALSEPVTETIEVPQITTIDGINVIDVQTTLKPSNISITYKGR